MNTEERQLSDLLHRLTPEPPRRVTVEDIAFRLANQAGQDRGGYREPRLRRSPRRFGGRGLVPALAALSVVAVAGLSAGIAVLASNHNPPSASGGGQTTTSAPASSSVSSTPVAVSTGPTTQPMAIDGAPWGAELIDHHTFTQNSLVSADGSLYAIAPGSLARIDPATGVVAEVSVSDTVPGPPVVVGHTVWVASYHPGGVVDLQGYDASTLARGPSLTVTSLGALSSSPEGVLAAGPGGTLFVAAGVTTVAVDPASGSVIHKYFLPEGVASVAVSPDGSTLYVGTGSTASTSSRPMPSSPGFEKATGINVNVRSDDRGHPLGPDRDRGARAHQADVIYTENTPPVQNLPADHGLLAPVDRSTLANTPNPEYSSPRTV